MTYHPLGGLGFANWAYEVARQERELGVFFDTIVVCGVTGSTHAGMIIDPVYEGKSMAGLIDLVRDGDIPATSKCRKRTSAAGPPSTRTAVSSARLLDGQHWTSRSDR